MHQFQDEAVTRPGRELYPAPVSISDFVECGSNDGLVTMVVGLHIRGYLSDPDRALIDSLGPRDRKVFVVQAGRLLHPADGVPFLLEGISIPEVPGADALFSQRCPGVQSRRDHVFRVQTGVVNPDEPEPILFGWFGCETTRNGEPSDDHFSETVRRLRLAYAKAAEPASRLRRMLDRAVPTVILARSSGSVMACNQAAADFVEKDGRDLVGIPWHQLQRFFDDAAGGHRVTMRHLTVGGIELTVISLSEGKALQNPNKYSDNSFLLRSARRTAARILAATGRLSCYSSGDFPEQVEPSWTVAEEVRRLDDLLRWQMTLMDETADERDADDPVEQIARSAGRVGALLKRPCRVEIHDNRPHHSRRAEHLSIGRLVDAVLEAHHGSGTASGPTQVALDPVVDGSDPKIRFDTEFTNQPIHLDQECLEYVRLTARRLGYEQLSSDLIDATILRTEFAFTTKPATDTL